MSAEASTRADIILERLGRGDLDQQSAASELFDIYFPVLMSYARKFPGVNEEEADAYVNPALLHAMRHLLRYKAPKTFPVVMLMHLRRVMRAEKPELTAPLDDDMLQADPSVTNRSEGAAVRAVMEKVLTPEESQLLLLQHMEGKSFAEIAAARDEPVSELQERLTRINMRFAEEARLLDTIRSREDAAK